MISLKNRGTVHSDHSAFDKPRSRDTARFLGTPALQASHYCNNSRKSGCCLCAAGALKFGIRFFPAICYLGRWTLKPRLKEAAGAVQCLQGALEVGFVYQNQRKPPKNQREFQEWWEKPTEKSRKKWQVGKVAVWRLTLACLFAGRHLKFENPWDGMAGARFKRRSLETPIRR